MHRLATKRNNPRNEYNKLETKQNKARVQMKRIELAIQECMCAFDHRVRGYNVSQRPVYRNRKKRKSTLIAHFIHLDVWKEAIFYITLVNQIEIAYFS